MRIGTPKFRTPQRARSVHGFLRQFAGDESGVLVAFSVFFMLIILFVGALGIDVIRFEAERTRLQHSLDQAVLAAADLDQKGEPRAVVADYFAKTGVDAELVSVSVDEGLSYKSVEARAKQDVKTQLLHMLGVDQLTAPAYSIAEERADKVEISLVLDLSTSMKGDKITNLRPAAKDFITTVLALSDSDDVSVNMVPFSSQVAVSPALMSEIKMRDTHNYSHCASFSTSDFDSLPLVLSDAAGTGYKQTEHLDPWTNSESPTGLKTDLASESQIPVCPTDASMQLLPLENNQNTLHTYIDNLRPLGNTSTDIGIKWAAALLDPANRPIVDSLIDAGEVNGRFAGRPYDHGTGEGLKIIVVMSDGQNAPEFSLASGKNSGNSNVWYNASTDRYALYDSGYYYSQAYSGNYAIQRDDGYYDYYYDYYVPPSNRFNSLNASWQRLTYPELYARASSQWVANYIYSNFDGNYWSNWYWGSFQQLDASIKDTRMDAICAEAKTQGIVIYTMSYAMSTDADEERGQTQLLNCASSPNFFFKADETNISEAFDAVAQSISQLKLTQ